MRIFTTLLLLLPVLGFSQTTNLLISEYGEGTPANRKYIEIYNGTGAAVNLANYEIWKTTNNGPWGTTTLALSGTLADGDAYVIANNVNDIPGADLYNGTLINWNGNDAVGLAWNGGSGTTFTVIDVVGQVNAASAADFDVAGVTGATKDKVLTRKSSVCTPTTDWTVSSGTDAATSQWIVSALAFTDVNQATVTAGLGSHTANCAAPCPTIPAPVAPAVSVCNGAQATLAATASQSGTLTWYDVATAGTSLGTGATYQTSALTTTTSFWVDETVTGCPVGPRTEVVVTVNALPTVGAGSDITVCTGANVTLNGTGAANYTWNNGITNGTAFVATATTTYTVTGTDANGCTATDDVTVTVSGTAPTVNAGQDQEVCAGGQVSLTATGTGTFTWDNGVQQAMPFTPTATTTYTVTVDDGVCTNTDQVVVTVFQPSVAGTASVSDVDACLGDLITGTITGHTGSVEWFVQAPGFPVYQAAGTTTTLSASAPLEGSYNVKVEVTNGVCPMVTSNIVVVVVNPLPTVNAGVDQTVCANTAVTLAGAGAATYVWTNNVTDNTPFTPTATATYTVTGTDSHGCMDDDAVVVTVTPLPTVNAGADVAVCPGDQVTLTGSGATTYSWNNGVTNAVPFTPAATATYTVTGTSNGCTNTDQVVVTVNAAPTATAANANNVLTATPAGQSYQWINCANNQPIAGATSATYTPTANGSYSVEVTNSSGCSATSSCVSVSTLSLDEAKAELSISLFPNPTKGKVTLAMSANDHVNVTVYNALGKVVSTINHAQNGTVIDLSENQSGVYMVQVKGEKGSSIHRIVKN